MSVGEQEPLLHVSAVRTGDTAIIRLDGELDCSTADQVDFAFADVLDHGRPPARVVVDAERLTFVDVSGLAPLIRARQRLPEGSAMQLRNARRQIVRVIRLLELSDLLGLAP